MDEAVTLTPSCPLGHTSPLVPYIRNAQDQFFGVPGTFNYVRCVDCGTLLLSPRPAPAELGRFYAPYYPEKLINQLKEDLVRRGRLRSPTRLRALGYLRKLTMLMGQRPPAGSKLLDVGCGLGQFPRLVREMAGLDVRGVDFDPMCKRAAMEMHNVTVDQGDLRDQRYPDGAFDLVTAWHVMEHVYDPPTELKEMVRVLKPGGWLMVETPTPSIYMRIFGKRWMYLQPPTHFFHYPPPVLAKLMEGAGVTVKYIQRPWFPGELAGSLLFTLGFRGFLPRLFHPGRTAWDNVVRVLFLLQMLYDIPVSIFMALLGRGGIVRVFAQKPAA